MIQQVRFLEVELLHPWMGHPSGSTHKLGERIAKMIIDRGTAKLKKVEVSEVPNKEEEVQTKEVEIFEEPKKEVKMETGKLNKMVKEAPGNKRRKRE